jgi:hypothetical protein
VGIALVVSMQKRQRLAALDALTILHSEFNAYSRVYGLIGARSSCPQFERHPG